jgi:uncharacterized iron-regulated membrane protein
MKVTLRKAMLQVHLWLGLIIGLVLAVQGISGAILAWRAPLDETLNRRLYVVTPGTMRLPLEELAARARAARPGAELEHVRAFAAADAPVIMGFTDDIYVHLNPYDGAVLGLRPRFGDALGWIEGLHKYLRLRPALGEPVVGTVAVGFIVIILTGVVLWWPATRRALQAGLTLNWKLTGRPWNLGLHKTLGIYVALIVLVSAATGAPVALKWLQRMFTAAESAPAAAAGAGKPFVGFDVIARNLDALMPAAHDCYIPLPKRGLVKTYAIAADAPHLNARSYVWFNPADGTVLRFTPYAKAGLGFRAYYWMLSLHTGLIGGWVAQVLLSLGALAVPVLVYTGAASYLQRKFRRSAPAPA